ncbi:MAG TPA: M28 family metallopeptidase [Polyangiaceae bacterium]|nr:M28 family metallopeptidase [Polyangiaceae bacterium]
MTSQRMRQTLDKLASFGEKRAGTWQNQAAGNYISDRFKQAGLDDVHCEEFSMNFYDVVSSSLTLTAAAAGETPVALPIAGHKVFAYSGEGSFQDVEVVDVGEGRAADYVAPVAGKVVLVRASQTFHRRNQLRNALERGAVAMISTSFSPSNLIQVGTVSPPELGIGPAPTISIGGTDGANIRSQIAAGKTVRAKLTVDAKLEVREAHNIVGRIKRPGSQWSDPYLLVGAHYDTWSTGSTDNGTGVAAMLEIASTLDKSTLQNDVVFVAYNAEEVGLLGGYDYLRKHVVLGGEAIKAFMNLEMIGRAKTELGGATLSRFFVHTQGGPMARLADEADVETVYPVIAGLENVAPTSGGNIPTDAQGFYWYGIDGTIGFGASPFYHTTADTPDTIDMPFLVSNTNALKNFLGRIDDEPAASFAPRDPTLYYPEVTTDSSNPSFLRVSVTVRDVNGAPVANPWARVQLYVNDFVTPQLASVPENLSAVQELVGDANGKVTFDIAKSLVQMGWSSRWVQVRVGNASERFPRGEGLKKLYGNFDDDDD